jgi:hypothetical protein
MSEEKPFICTARGVPCECDKKGCITKRDPLDRIADALDEVAFQLRYYNERNIQQ